MNKLAARAAVLVEHPAFRNGVIAVILFNALVIGLDTSTYLHSRYATIFETINQIILGLFIIEALIKMCALFPSSHHYFKDGWNCFDFAYLQVLVA